MYYRKKGKIYCYLVRFEDFLLFLYRIISDSFSFILLCLSMCVDEARCDSDEHIMKNSTNRSEMKVRCMTNSKPSLNCIKHDWNCSVLALRFDFKKKTIFKNCIVSFHEVMNCFFSKLKWWTPGWNADLNLIYNRGSYIPNILILWPHIKKSKSMFRLLM